MKANERKFAVAVIAGDQTLKISTHQPLAYMVALDDELLAMYGRVRIEENGELRYASWIDGVLAERLIDFMAWAADQQVTIVGGDA